MIDEDIYGRREQTGVKHFILRHYLERFAHIVGSHWESITYVDGFAGPWNARSSDLKDSSFAIALDELRRARATHEQRGRHLRLRCFFLEQNKKAFAQLEAFAESTKDVEVLAQNATFEDSIKDIRICLPPSTSLPPGVGYRGMFRGLEFFWQAWSNGVPACQGSRIFLTRIPSCAVGWRSRSGRSPGSSAGSRNWRSS